MVIVSVSIARRPDPDRGARPSGTPSRRRLGIVLHSGISATAIVAVVLNVLFNEITVGNRSGASVFAAAEERLDELGERLDDDIKSDTRRDVNSAD